MKKIKSEKILPLFTILVNKKNKFFFGISDNNMSRVKMTILTIYMKNLEMFQELNHPKKKNKIMDGVYKEMMINLNVVSLLDSYLKIQSVEFKLLMIMRV